MTVEIAFTDEDWGRIERDYSAWWAGELDRPLVYLTGAAPGAKVPEVNRFIPNHPADCSAEEICERFDPGLRAQRFYGDAFPYWFVNFGAGVVAAFLGAKLNARPRTVWFEPAERREMKDIHAAFAPENVWWRRVVDVTKTACEFWGGRVAVSHADLGGTLDILASLRGTQELLVDLVDAPDETERVVWEISAVWRECYDRLAEIIAASNCRGTVPWSPTWSQRRTYMLQCDFCYMISPAMFERFVLPELTAVCDFLDDPFYHLDGVGARPHLDKMLEIESLKGVQWVAGAGKPPSVEWPDVQRRIREGGKLCQVGGPPDKVLDVVRATGGKGYQFLVGGGFSADDARAFLAEVDRARAEHARG